MCLERLAGGQWSAVLLKPELGGQPFSKAWVARNTSPKVMSTFAAQDHKAIPHALVRGGNWARVHMVPDVFIRNKVYMLIAQVYLCVTPAHPSLACFNL